MNRIGVYSTKLKLNITVFSFSLYNKNVILNFITTINPTELLLSMNKNEIQRADIYTAHNQGK